MDPLPQALVIDDESSVRGFVAEVLRSEGWHVIEAMGAADAFLSASQKRFALIFCDVMLGGDEDGYAVLRRFSAEQPEARFVLMTGHGSAAGALDATAIGAFDYLVKPFSVSDVLGIASVVREQLERRKDEAGEGGGVYPEQGYRSDIPLIGKSHRFVECLKVVGRVAPTSLSVLITGESGTGKEIIANAIHRRSKRAEGSFVTVNCGAIPMELIESELFGHVKGSFTGAAGDRIGLWEEAAGGTLFLDEITETPPQFQVKLLRALQEGEIRRVGANKTIKVDARVIGATNRDIEKEVAEGRFRQDLMYRLNAVTIKLPPLRERQEDIPLLAEHVATRIAETKIGFSREAMLAMQHYDWPGNVRELENAVLHAVSMADNIVYPEHLPVRVRENSSDPIADLTDLGINGTQPRTTSNFPPLAEMEVLYVTRVLEHTGGNKQAAARLLDIDRKTLSRILARGGS